MGEITRQIIWFLVIILLSFGHGVKGRRTSPGNKNAVKTIHSEGDIIDCVDIYKQPAFDHPLLKNHTIQMRPSWYPNEASTEPKISSKERVVSSQVWNKFEKCPAGTIPIYRTQNNDNVVPEFVRAFGEKSTEGIPFPKKDKYGDQNAEYAGMYVKDKYFYGASQRCSVWTPQLESPSEYSAAATWLVNNEGSETDVIGAGWMVKPSLFGNNDTRLFVSWNKVAGSQTTGCYNLFCPGFIQTTTKVALGDFLIQGLDTYYDIVKDPNTGHWWFTFEDIPIGYWPASMFTNLQVALRVVWAGQVLNTKPGRHHTATQMGNGIFPGEKQKAASFYNLKVRDGGGKWDPITDLNNFKDSRYCYDSQIMSLFVSDAFYFGGPGRGPSCM
ncbi:hypothetical protein AMTRI_Chr06g171220 [Amborella trichopoda]